MGGIRECRRGLEDIPPHWVVRSIIATLKKAKPYLEQRYHVREISVFGSYARNEQSPESDLDILVDLDEPLGWDIVDLKEDLEGMLGIPVDLVLKGGVSRRPGLSRAIEEDAVYAWHSGGHQSHRRVYRRILKGRLHAKKQRSRAYISPRSE